MSSSSSDCNWGSDSIDGDDSWNFVSKTQCQEPHTSDKFGLKKGRCHTCLSLLADNENHTLPPTSCLNDFGAHLDAPRCLSCLEVANMFDRYRSATYTPEEARAAFPKLERLVCLTHRRKEENEDKILKAVENNLDRDLKGLQKMLEKCRPEGTKGETEITQRGHAEARDVALGQFDIREDRSSTPRANNPLLTTQEQANRNVPEVTLSGPGLSFPIKIYGADSAVLILVHTLVARTLVSGLLSARMPSNPLGQTPNIHGLNALAVTGTCEAGFTECDDGCMPTTSTCCGTGGYCDAGEYCTALGCCPTGEVCSGLSECASGKEECGDGCMPEGSVCCSGGGYCDAGEVCSSSGTCDKATGGTSGGGSTSGGGAVGCSAGKTTCDDDYCIPSDGSTCCNTGLGKYCEAGTYCVTGGCCEDGKICTGGSGSSIFSSGDGDDDDDGGLGSVFKPTKTSGSSGAGATNKNMGGKISTPLGLMVAVAAVALVPML
ncbi:hypothetical protein B0T16DRAFT_392717 [Cercophora newfieldiana]|uniref:Uncharacterized protein n=1 Tax=Cercophora newfieldiana TaxID=92897 RepID=A0AA39Y1M6_9PEZI|nr:hypothetical protein B0T16DRAFT_392717 [Cercophora newfieldiana]